MRGTCFISRSPQGGVRWRTWAHSFARSWSPDAHGARIVQRPRLPSAEAALECCCKSFASAGPHARSSPLLPSFRFPHGRMAARTGRSLAGGGQSLDPCRPGSPWRRAFAFLAPGYLVAVGYMDPGNWATSLAGGAKFGYTLLVVALVSNIMAIVLQSLCARLAVASGRDLAQACRDAFPRPVAWTLWVVTEIAICATDLAEVIGTAIGLNLLFGIPLDLCFLITALDV